MGVEISATYQGRLTCSATHGPSSATLKTEAPLDNGGTGGDFSPTDLVATALGTCVMTIVGIVAQRHKLDVQGMTVNVTKEMVSEPARRIGSLVTEVTIPADAVPEAADRRRIEAAAGKCPVHQSLHPSIDAPIRFVYA